MVFETLPRAPRTTIDSGAMRQADEGSTARSVPSSVARAGRASVPRRPTTVTTRDSPGEKPAPHTASEPLGKGAPSAGGQRLMRAWPIGGISGRADGSGHPTGLATTIGHPAAGDGFSIEGGALRGDASGATATPVPWSPSASPGAPALGAVTG